MCLSTFFDSRARLPEVPGLLPACASDVALALFDERTRIDHRHAFLSHQTSQLLQTDGRKCGAIGK
jgi:hypothetical protein